MNENLILKTLRIRPFLFLILSEFFSQFSMNIFNFILLIIVFGIAKSNSAVSGVVIAFTLPTVVFGILAGIMVDRWDKKKVLIITNILRALMVLPLAFFHGNLALIYLVTFGVSLITQFFIPAETPIIPILVKNKYLLSANALFGMVMYSSIFLAYALSGPFLFLFGKDNVFIFLTILFIIAAVFASIIKFKKLDDSLRLREEAVVIGFSQELKILINLVSKTKNLYHALFSLTLAQILIYVLAVIGPGYAERVLRIKVESFPIFFVTPAIIGMAIGATIIGSFLHKSSKSNLTKIGLLVLGIAILLMPYGAKLESREIVQFINFYLPYFLQINVLHIMVVLAFIIGFATAFVFVPANTILQEETTDESRGKIYGLLNSLVGVLAIFPVILVGSLADIIGIKFVITGIGFIIISIAMLRIFIMDKN